MKKSIMIVSAALSAGVFAMPDGFTDDWDAVNEQLGKMSKGEE